MYRKEIFKRAFWALVLTGVVDWLAVSLYLYWTVWWIDIIAHFLGGVTVGFASVWAYSYVADLKQVKTSKLLLVALMGGIVVGIIWEIFELYFQITTLSDGIAYWRDTLSDLMMDSIGSICAFISIKFSFRKNE